MIPLNLKIVNFFSHTESEIDFTKFDSALLIGNTEGDYTKSNGSGKSVVFEAILWCLFNKSRSAMMDDIIRWGETTCSVDMEFKHGDETYRVKRNRNRINSSSVVEFHCLDKAGDWIDRSCSTSGDTNKKIEETIKLDHKTFINSIYFRQNDISEFAEVEASKKKEILKSIVDISRWDTYEKAARKKAKEISLECKVLKKSVEDYDITHKGLEDVKLKIKASKEKAEALISKRDSCIRDISSLESKYLELKSNLDTDTYDKATEEISTLTREVTARKKTIAEYEGKSAGLARERSPVASGVENLKRFLAGKEIVEINETKISDLTNELSFHKIEKSSSEELIRNLNDIEISQDHCYVCRQDISQELYDSLKKDVSSKKSSYQDKKRVATEEVLSVEKELNALLKSQADNDKITKAKDKLEAEGYKLSILDENIARHNLDLKNFVISLEKITDRLESNKSLLESIKNEDFQALRKNIKVLKAERVEISESLSKEDINAGRLLERESNLSSSIKKMLKDKKSIAKKLANVATFEKLGRMFGKNGIQAVLLDTIIEDLEKTSNVILSSICNEPAAIVLETQRVGSDGVSTIETLDLKVQKDGHLQNFKSLSGGEKFRISLALRIGLSDMSSRYGGSSLEFLLLDEVNSPLDRYGVETLFVNVIKALEDKYKILVITHDESLKEKFDNVIDVTKVSGESTIRFTTR
jgi:exonuclease SbcC